MAIMSKTKSLFDGLREKLTVQKRAEVKTSITQDKLKTAVLTTALKYGCTQEEIIDVLTKIKK